MRGRIGVKTANDEVLTRPHLDAAGIPPDVPLAFRRLQGFPAFADPLLLGIGEIDLAEMGAGVPEVATRLLANCPDIKAFVCARRNLPPFSAAMRQARLRH